MHSGVSGWLEWTRAGLVFIRDIITGERGQKALMFLH